LPLSITTAFYHHCSRHANRDFNCAISSDPGWLDATLLSLKGSAAECVHAQGEISRAEVMLD
jgi:hypothetical protein